jgi:hypothetical protein
VRASRRLDISGPVLRHLSLCQAPDGSCGSGPHVLGNGNIVLRSNFNVSNVIRAIREVNNATKENKAIVEHRFAHCLQNRLTDGSKVVSPTHALRSTLQKHYFSASGTHFS